MRFKQSRLRDWGGVLEGSMGGKKRVEGDHGQEIRPCTLPCDRLLPESRSDIPLIHPPGTRGEVVGVWVGGGG